MKATIALAVLLSAAVAFSQTTTPVDIRISTPGPYYQLGTGLKWGVSGKGGINNAFLIFPQKPGDNLCVTIRNNNPSAGHVFAVSADQARDANVKGYYSTPSPGGYLWDPSYVIGNTPSIGSLSQYTFMVPAMAASEVAIVITASVPEAGTPDTADIFAVATQSQSCGMSDFAMPDFLGVLTQGGQFFSTQEPFPRQNGEIPVTKSGYETSEVNTNLTATTTCVPLFRSPAGGATFSACSFYIAVTALNAGTLNAFVQTYLPDGTYQDLISFNQWTGPGYQIASTATGSAETVAPHSVTDGGLSAGSELNLVPFDGLEVKYVLNGGATSATASAYMVCQ